MFNDSQGCSNSLRVKPRARCTIDHLYRTGTKRYKTQQISVEIDALSIIKYYCNI